MLGAETLAPYEYYYAREHLEQAQFEAAEASYSDAAHYAETAEEYASKAVEIARAAQAQRRVAMTARSRPVGAPRAPRRQRGRRAAGGGDVLVRPGAAPSRADRRPHRRRGQGREERREALRAARARNGAVAPALRRDRARPGRDLERRAPPAHRRAERPRRPRPEPRGRGASTTPSCRPSRSSRKTRTRTATASPTRRTSASSSPRTSTATRTTTAARIRTTTTTASPTSLDKCPNQPEDFDGFQDEDGCPDPDNDKRHGPRRGRLLSRTPRASPAGHAPAARASSSSPRSEIRITQQIHFEFNKAKIRPESFPILDAIVDVLKDQHEDLARGPGAHRQRRQARPTTRSCRSPAPIRSARTSSSTASAAGV